MPEITSDFATAIIIISVGCAAILTIGFTFMASVKKDVTINNLKRRIFELETELADEFKRGQGYMRDR